MGFSYSNDAARREHNRIIRERDLEEAREEDAKRVLLANKIAMMVSDKLANELIRPGPVAEERECYQMAQELRDMNPELVKLIVAILKVEKVELP